MPPPQFPCRTRSNNSGSDQYTEIWFSVELTFALSLTGLLSHLGSNICKTQDHSHSDTTKLYYIYTYLHIFGHGEKIPRRKI